MIKRNLFLKANFTGIINFSELDWIKIQQFNINGLEESIITRLGKMIDSEIINIGCRLTA